MTAITPVYEDPRTGLKELILFHAVSQGWLNQTTRILQVTGAVGDSVQVPIKDGETGQVEVEEVALTVGIEHVTRHGLHRSVRVGHGERSNTILFQLLGNFTLAKVKQ